MAMWHEHTSLLKYTSHNLFERVDVGYVWEVSWKRGQTATYWPKVPLTIAALHSHPGWAAQQWVTEGRKPSVCKLIFTLASCPQLTPTATGTELTHAVCGTWLYNCLRPTCFLWTYASASNSTMSTGQGFIPISLTGCTCFAFFRLFTQVHLLADSSVEGQYVTHTVLTRQHLGRIPVLFYQGY